jgi:bifunctional UDP-N-acetylglucosamine pyrophosphorylase/glucosamine-1-phosphate N-acetyltransferase
VPAFTVVIMAAGQGTRMRSVTPKVLHPLCGRPLVRWPIDAALEAGAGRVVVVGGSDRALAEVLPDGVELAVQAEARGTGDAVAAAADHLDRSVTVVVLSADVPLVDAGMIGGLVAAHEEAGAAATVLTMELDDPGSYGRVVRGPDGSVERVVEVKAAGDATPEQLALREVNTGIYAFAGADLLDTLPRLGDDNAQGEYYLPDVLPLIREGGGALAARATDDVAATLGVNDRVDLARVAAVARARINRAHMEAGVTFEDPMTTYVEPGVVIGRDTVLAPGTSLMAGTTIGEGCRIGPHATLAAATVGDRVTVIHSHLSGCELRDGVTVGPFAYLRPGTVLHEGAKAGTFVEIKNSDVGPGAKVPHLSYIGDADVGEGTNLGAATITANYDGRAKHRTTIGAHVHTSVDTTFVAPVAVGDGAYTGAGSVITDDVPAGALGIARERQRNIEGYADRVGGDEEQPGGQRDVGTAS